jgi:hypothetical protein
MEISSESNISGGKSDKAPEKTNRTAPLTSDKMSMALSSSGKKQHSSGQSLKKTPNLSDKLGKDSKLMQQEQKHQYDNNLCLFCRQTGHMAKECLKSLSSASKGRAAKTTETKSELKPATDTKNSQQPSDLCHEFRAALNPSMQPKRHASTLPLFLTPTLFLSS